MSDASFAASWLALREPVDHRSRAEALAARVAEEGSRRGWTRALDLGTGTGSNLRYLDPRLPWVRRWVVVDRDADLLDRLTDPRDGRTLRRISGDLAAEGLEAIPEADLVTASALLDLVSEAWMRAAAAACRAAGAGAIFALTYDGSFRFGSAEPGDTEVREAVNRHQERDKGLGAALGPSASAVAEEAFRAEGYRTEVVDSPWVLSGPGDAPLALELVEGWARAATEVLSPGQEPGGDDPAASRIEDWHRRRRERIRTGRYRIEVGHRDLLALPRR